jgi:hypothetical protein
MKFKIQNSKFKNCITRFGILNFRSRKYANGFAAFITIVLMVMVSLIVIAGFAFFALQEVKINRALTKSLSSYFVSEAGIEDALYRLLSGKQLSDGEVLAVGKGTTTIFYSSSGQNRIIRSEGFRETYRRNLETKVAITTDAANFYYGVQVGEGGLEMSENSEVIGNINSNGDVLGANGAKISGDAVVAGNVAESTQARSTVCNQDQVVGQTNPRIDFSQSFNAPSTARLVKVSLYIKKVGNPGDRAIYIVTDSSGSPSQTSLASATLSSSLVTTQYGWIDIVFSSPPLLTAGNNYWIVLDASQNSTRYWVWCSDSNNSYGNGVGKYKTDWSSGGSWTTITGDLNFRTYFGSGIHTLNNVIVTGTAWANTITNSKICGDAYYQSIDRSSLDFLNSPSSPTCPTPLTNGTAFPNSTDQPPANMPISQANIDQWKSDAGAGGQIAGDYNVTSDVSLGPKEITGNLNMTSNNKTLTVTGTLYVRGNIDISNGSAIRCASSYGENSCVIVSDGWIHVANNGKFSGSGTQGSYLMMLTTLACTGSPGANCTHHNAAIDIHNNVGGVIFYASQGMINLHNGVGINEAVAYKLRLDNNAVITYEQGLTNAKFSSGPSGGYEVIYWKETE